MNKSAGIAICLTLTLAACSTFAPPPPPPPVVAVVKAPDLSKPKPLTLLYTTFQDHAVLQQGKTIPVWGQTQAGATVEVQLNGQSASATADAKGQWRVDLPAMKAGGPYTLSAKSSTGESQVLTDIMIGDVYLCSGQSNMELPLKLATNYGSELAGATNAMIRLFHVQRFTSPAPHAVFGADASWAVLSPDSAKEFSATCYYFGRDVQPAAGTAVGLIEDAWGGSAIQAWISNDKFAAIGGYDEMLKIVKDYARDAKLGDIEYRAVLHKLLEEHDPAMKAAPAWFDAALDDSGWNECTATGGWQSCPKTADPGGIFWLRKTIELTAAEAQGPAMLELGQLCNNDLTFVNGVEVGGGEGYDVARHYTVPAGTLHEGKNVIAIAIMTGSGLLDPAAKMGLKLGNGVMKPLAGAWKWNGSVAAAKTPVVPHQPWLNQFGLSTLYNGMIVPLGATQVRGIVWYQGETDTNQPVEYERLLKALIEDWRGKFGADTPFYVVQLPGFGTPVSKPGASNWARLRESQRLAVDALPNTGLAVATDLGVPDNIHPQMKQAVGHRLALIAQQNIYGKDVEGASPAPLTVSRSGKTVIIRFAHTGKGLVTREWSRTVGFALCTTGDDCRYAPGVADKDVVKLDASQSPKASKVRFCWSDTPWCNLYSAEGLPAVPFEMPISAAKKPAKKVAKP